MLPLPWKNKVAHRLGNNYSLAKAILKSEMKQFAKCPEKIMMTDDVIKKQLDDGVIEKVDNFSKFREIFPRHSFLGHIRSVFRLEKESSKCRVVYLSNLCEKPTKNSTHNQALYQGPCLNKKLSTALIFLRFDKFMLTLDIRKAFLQILIPEIDQSKLLFLWFKNVKKKDFSIEVFKAKRLIFGLPCSPTMLMVALYLLLISHEDPDDDLETRNLKLHCYNNACMDNLAVSFDSADKINFAREKLPKIFSKF